MRYSWFVIQSVGEILMPTYIMLVNFTAQGRKGVKEVPTGKTNRARQLNNLALKEKLSG